MTTLPLDIRYIPLASPIIHTKQITNAIIDFGLEFIKKRMDFWCTIEISHKSP